MNSKQSQTWSNSKRFFHQDDGLRSLSRAPCARSRAPATASAIEASDASGKSLPFHDALEKAIKVIVEQTNKRKKQVEYRQRKADKAAALKAQREQT